MLTVYLNKKVIRIILGANDKHILYLFYLKESIFFLTPARILLNTAISKIDI